MIKNKKVFFITIILLVTLILFFLIQFVYKKIISGNNIIKSDYDLIEYILNISSYEAKLEVTVYSNKTINKYLLEQYYMEPNYSKQIVREPKNLENLEIIYNGNNLEIKNTNIGLSKIYQNYSYLNDNLLWINFFIDNCKENYEIEQSNEEIILYNNFKEYKFKLYISKKTKLPTKIEVLDNNNQSKIYIEYKEIKLNNVQENNIFAYLIKDIKKEV